MIIYLPTVTLANHAIFSLKCIKYEIMIKIEKFYLNPLVYFIK